MNTVIQPGDRVRVVVEKSGYHKRSFSGVAVGWTKSGLLKVREDGSRDARSYSSEHVRKIKSA